MPRYNENFPRMVKYMVRMLESGAEHWFPDPDCPGQVRPPGFAMHVPVHVAMYASVFGRVQSENVPKNACGNSWCVRPEHQALRFTGRKYPIPDMRPALFTYQGEFPQLLAANYPRPIVT